nr:MAG TPA: hypothetical protein [Caudoviricetes sp.]
MEKQSAATFGKGYEVNCCAVAACCDLPHRSGTEKHRQARQRQSGAWRREGMAEKSADVICEGKVVHRNDSLRQGFASDALAWQREEMP